MLPTVAEILALDPLRRGAPKVVAAADRLDAPVRWVHVIELAEAAHLLRGGELVLSTGIALPDDPTGLARYVADLASVGVSALAVELGSRYARSLPAALVSAASGHRLPLIVLQRETQFIEITEAVHARIIDAQLEELRASEHLHQVFTDLAVSGAPAGEVVRQAAALSGCPLILENVAHQVLACEPAGHDTARLLAGFAARSRVVTPAGRTGYDPASGWLVTVVGARGEDWGRLIMVRGGPAEPRDVALVERAATTLALGRLLDHERESLERQAHRTILGAFLGHGYAEPAEAEARARALGVPVAGRALLAVVVRLSHGDTGLEAHARALRTADVMAAACRSAQVPALVGTLDDIRVGGLLALAPRADPDAALSRLAAQLRRQLGDDDVIGAGVCGGLGAGGAAVLPRGRAGGRGGRAGQRRSKRRWPERDRAGRGPAGRLPAAGPAAARPAAPAPRRPAGAGLCRAGARAAAAPRRRHRQPAAEHANRVPGGGRQQGRGGQARAPGPAHAVRAAAPDRGRARGQPRVGPVAHVTACRGAGPHSARRPGCPGGVTRAPGAGA